MNFNLVSDLYRCDFSFENLFHTNTDADTDTLSAVKKQ